MQVQQADGTLWPNVTRVEYFKMDNPNLPWVVFLQDLDVGGNVLVQSAPEAAGGGPDTWVTRATVALGAKAMEMVIKHAAIVGDQVYVRFLPDSSKVEFSLHAASSFHYTRHKE